ncbi:MAG: ABC transporter permease [Solirubrobacteraceae bacterium]|nr:ABC transporter permease [Solirubrobacteraceae bacterium]
MNANIDTVNARPATADPPPPPTRRQTGASRRPLARFAVLGLLVAFIAVFSLLRPDSFATTDNFKTILVENAVLTILALAVMVPLIANDFDLSVAAVLGLGAMLTAGLAGKSGIPVPLVIVLVLAIGAAIGAIHALLIVRFDLPSFVVTLGTNSVVGGMILLYSGGNTLFEGIPKSLTDLGTSDVAGIGLPVIYMAVIALVLWFVLDRRPAGRLLYAVGAGESAARLAGVPTRRVRAIALITAGTLAAFAGIVLTARIGSANPTANASFFLPAFAGAFLSLAAFQLGRFNALGVVASVYLLAVGVSGLQILGVPSWVEPMFNGTALVLAIALSRLTPGSSRRVGRL